MSKDYRIKIEYIPKGGWQHLKQILLSMGYRCHTATDEGYSRAGTLCIGSGHNSKNIYHGQDKKYTSITAVETYTFEQFIEKYSTPMAKAIYGS